MLRTLKIFFLCFFCLTLSAEQINIYLCSRLTPAARAWNDVITKELSSGCCIFRPQDIDLSGVSAKELDLAAFEADFEGMNRSDVLLVLPSYGRDCAWEIGWFCGRGKPTIAYAEEKGEWLQDGKVKGGLSAIVTNNPILYETLLEDPTTKNKSYLVSCRKSLLEIIEKVGQANGPLP